MRLIKMLGLTAVAAVAAMAFIGASSAAAESTVLCKEHPAGACPAGQQYASGTLIKALASDPKLLTNLGTVLCEKSDVWAEALGLASPLVTHVKLFDFTNCKETSFGTSCEVKQVKLGLLLLLKTALNLGTLSSDGNTEALVSCPSLFGFHCTYGGKPTGVHAVGSSSPTTLGVINTNGAALTSTGGGFCPSTSNWDATYTIDSPDPVFIAS